MDQRLTLVKEMARPCRCGADIGTDHGYLICALVEENIAQTGIAADINPMPLDKARREVARRGLEGRVRLVLTDGLADISPQEVDQVFIAGMGGDLIAQILDRWPKYLKNLSSKTCQNLLFQCHEHQYCFSLQRSSSNSNLPPYEIYY